MGPALPLGRARAHSGGFAQIQAPGMSGCHRHPETASLPAFSLHTGALGRRVRNLPSLQRFFCRGEKAPLHSSHVASEAAGRASCQGELCNRPWGGPALPQTWKMRFFFSLLLCFHAPPRYPPVLPPSPATISMKYRVFSPKSHMRTTPSEASPLCAQLPASPEPSSAPTAPSAVPQRGIARACPSSSSSSPAVGAS